jgi:SAM-dependent methyltransferase
MTLEQERVRAFWDKQAKKVNKLGMESVANLEENADLLALKVTCETGVILPALALSQHESVLDLGSGTGQWAFKFARHARTVCGVEFSREMIAIANREAKHRLISNVSFIHQDAQTFVSNSRFDVIFISGLLIYLNDDDLEQLAFNCRKNILPNGRLFIRDGTGIFGRFEINRKYSDDLNSEYSAIYRTADDYISFFQTYGFKIEKHTDMFADGSPLNKWDDTRLRFYSFRA